MAGRGKNGEPTIPHLPVSLATLFPHQIIESNLPGRAKEMLPVLGNQYSNLWRRLRVENAPLPILRNDALASAPISFFDPPCNVSRDVRGRNGYRQCPYRYLGHRALSDR